MTVVGLGEATITYILGLPIAPWAGQRLEIGHWKLERDRVCDSLGLLFGAGLW
jgi:hypothetical protein